MELNITIELWQKGNWYLARSPDLDFIAQGRTVEEAKGNLFEIIKIQFTEMEEMGTLKDYLTECGFEIKRAIVIPEYDEIDVEIIKNNMRTVNMSRDEYFELLDKV